MIKDTLPPKASELCRTCGRMLDAIHVKAGIEYHPSVACDPQLKLEERNHELRDQILEVIHWVDDNAERTMQVEIGPSSMGDPCDQYVTRVLAAMPVVNHRSDPWSRIVGTAVHTWLEKAVGLYQDGVANPDVALWRTEVAMMVDEMIPAHSDLYTNDHDVVDWKTSTLDAIKKMKSKGIPEWYRVQGHTYAYAHVRAGRPVRDVVFVFLPRAGRLRDMYLFREPYDESIALNAIKRVYELGSRAVELDVMNKPEAWGLVPLTPGDSCWNCEFYSPALAGANDRGCPGTTDSIEARAAAAEEKFSKGLIKPKDQKG